MFQTGVFESYAIQNYISSSNHSLIEFQKMKRKFEPPYNMVWCKVDGQRSKYMVQIVELDSP